MHQLKALIWKSLKVRYRSPYTTLFDLLSPIVLILLYLALRFFIIAPLSSPQLTSDIIRTDYFKGSNFLDPRRDLGRHLCNKILYYSSQGSGDSIGQAIASNCGLELIQSSSRDELVKKLEHSLNSRIAYRKDATDFNRSNATQGCTNLQNTQEPLYQAGLARMDRETIEIHMTDLAGSSVIHVPFSQGSYYNEYRSPHSDLNSGIHLLELCIANAFTGISGNRAYESDHPILQQETYNNSINNELNQTFRANDLGLNLGNLRWRAKPYPEITGIYLVPAITMLIILLVNFCNSIVTLYRETEANELGQFHQLRLAGATAGYYWLSQWTIMLVHMIVQSLIISILLAIPTSDYLLDPICDMSISLRWALLTTYSLAINTHALFIASLFSKASHALLCGCLVGSCYATYPMLIMLQWTPYGFSSLWAALTYLNPASNFEALCLVMFGVSFQTNQTFNLSHLSQGIIGGGFSDFTVGQLWSFLIMHDIGWFILTIIVDQLHYNTTRSPIGCPLSFFNEFLCCNRFGPKGDFAVEDVRTKSSTALKSMMSHMDPNRICCSVRHVSVKGPTIMIAQTKGDTFKLTREQLDYLKPKAGKTYSRTNQYLVERRSSATSLSMYQERERKEDWLIDEAIQQHIVWFKTEILFENLNLDFKFNQVSFVLGQTDTKNLLFDTLLGLRRMRAGSVIIDGAKFDSTTIGLARRQIGFLSEKDVFFNELTIFENLQLFGSIRDQTYEDFDSESLFVLSLLHLSSRKDDYPTVLTSRSQRKLALGVAAVGYSKLLLLTEPTMSLHWRPRCQVLNLLKKYKSIRSIVVDTSDIDEAATFGDRIVLLKNGKVDLDDTPIRLSKRLGCGYWLIFEPTSGGGRSVNSEAIKALEKMSNEIFKQDKLDLDATKRSVYHATTGIETTTSEYSPPASPAIKTDAVSAVQGEDDLHRLIVILKVRQTQESTQALCTILKMFSQHNIHGFKLVELTYESLEDILVLRMSRAIYPNLPPDLLLSLQHRTQVRDRTSNTAPVSVRKYSGNLRSSGSIFGVSIKSVIKDRMKKTSEIFITLITLTISVIIVLIALLLLRYSLAPPTSTSLVNSRMMMRVMMRATNDNNNQTSPPDSLVTMGRAQAGATVVRHSDIEQLFRYRIGLQVFNDSLTTTKNYLEHWSGNAKLTGSLSRASIHKTDAEFLASLVHDSKDLASSIIFFDPKTNEALITYESHLPHVLFGSIKTFIAYATTSRAQYRNLSAQTVADDRPTANRSLRNFARSNYGTSYKTSRHLFYQPWHEMVRGFFNRRYIYGLGFALAEAFATGIMVVAPIRHRTESKVTTNSSRYWLGMAVFDLGISLILIATYTLLFIVIEGAATMVVPLFLVLFLYKVATLPIPYIISLAAETSRNGFLCIVLLYVTVGWEFAITMRTFVEYTMIHQSYVYTVAVWILLAVPLGSLIDALVVVNQINSIDKLCPYVPVYTATTNIVDLEGVQRYAVIDDLLEKVRECLANGKRGVSTDVLHQKNLGILWSVYLMILFGLVSWTFLLTSERLFGILARRFNSAKTSLDPMKTVVRFPDKTNSLFHWDRERDRLISEYIRCLNEIKYVKLMATNCLLLRVWLKPMSDQSSFDKHLSNILEPLYSLGHTKNDIQVELKTTLQIFIRIGDESKRCRLDKVQLIETYSKYVASHSDTIAKFAVADWTRDTLYKILLHGHYNTKSKLSSD